MENNAAVEVHISSLIIQVIPENLKLATKKIRANKFSEVHLISPEGKIVVVLETSSRFEVTETVEAFKAIEGVLNVVMVYHQMEDAARMDDLYETDEMPNPKNMEMFQ